MLWARKTKPKTRVLKKKRTWNRERGLKGLWIWVWIRCPVEVSPCHTGFTQDPCCELCACGKVGDFLARPLCFTVGQTFSYRTIMIWREVVQGKGLCDYDWLRSVGWILAVSRYGIAIIIDIENDVGGLGVKAWRDENLTGNVEKSNLATAPCGCVPTEIDVVRGVGVYWDLPLSSNIDAEISQGYSWVGILHCPQRLDI